MKNLKQKVLIGLASTAMMGGICVGGIGALAADTADTPVKVTFDPDGHIVIPEDGDDLSLRFVPALVDFDTHTAGTAVTSNVTLSNRYVALRDIRPGTSGTDWKLSAEASVLTSATSAAINTGTIKLSVGDTLDWTEPLEPSSTNLGSVAAGVTETASVTLPLGGSSVEVAKSSTGARQGFAVPIEAMELNLAAADTNHPSDTFEGNVTWTLSDTI
ncbi:WxL domain-containing protein [Candidatus Enterococcus ferrettii]|uniref:WxL domain-containing protein n=1 Tax=Candidatus Enterococcus ferrettii TaxID=2815324 RepID=A0ABV0ENP6_9ENTE|nr:WxL domain-containing protein [Enterococcus sp. 665A]MBO1341920.1 WxL domain-containing protein [Enterococcus sp. 665A]